MVFQFMQSQSFLWVFNLTECDIVITVEDVFPVFGIKRFTTNASLLFKRKARYTIDDQSKNKIQKATTNKKQLFFKN